MYWTGVVLSAVPAIMLLMAASMSLLQPAMVAEGMAKYGYPENVLPILVCLQLGCVVFYLVPRTAVVVAENLSALMDKDLQRLPRLLDSSTLDAFVTLSAS